MFRGKKSSNRIELSQLVQELLNFGVFSFLRLLGWGVGGWGWEMVGCAPHTCAHACAHTHAHARTCMRGKHDNFMQMATPIGGIPRIPYDVIHTCMCMHMHMNMRMHVHVGGVHPLTTPTPIHPPPPPGGTSRIIQNSIALELIEIFQFCLKI